MVWGVSNGTIRSDVVALWGMESYPPGKYPVPGRDEFNPLRCLLRRIAFESDLQGRFRGERTIRVIGNWKQVLEGGN